MSGAKEDSCTHGANQLVGIHAMVLRCQHVTRDMYNFFAICIRNTACESTWMATNICADFPLILPISFNPLTSVGNCRYRGVFQSVEYIKCIEAQRNLHLWIEKYSTDIFHLEIISISESYHLQIQQYTCIILWSPMAPSNVQD